ncbi:MAG: acyltransferase family protein [Ilumatobacteraceae bacterium]
MADWSPPSTPKGQISRVPHLPGLDGLRAVAVVAVMVYHANRNWLHGGFLGVEVFFVISGYLITLLLIAEHERSGRVDLKQFWLRRARRLLPALFGMLALLVVYLAVGFRNAQGRTRGDILGGIGYVSNWYQIWVGAGYTAAEAFAPLRHLWSLAVEEQFYLLWPIIMVAILAKGRAHLPRVALWLIGVSVGIALVTAVLFVPGDINSACTPEAMHGYWKIGGRCVSVNDALYLGTFTRAGGLMMGAAFAMVWRPMALMRGPMRDKHRQLDLLALLGVAALCYLFWKLHLADPALTLNGSRFDPWLFRGGLFATGAATLLVIAAVTHQRSVAGVLLGNPLFDWIGTRSYGLYLYHWPIYQIIRKEAGLTLSVSQFVVAMIVTVPLTEISYRYLEMPIRRGAIGHWLRRERRRPSRAALARRRQLAAGGLAFTVLLGWAGVSIAMAPNLCVGEVECSLVDPGSDPGDAGGIATTTVPDDATATTASTVADQGSTPTTAIPGGSTSTPTTAAPTTTEPPPPPPPVAVGESVMLGAITQLQTGGFNVVAEISHQADWIIAKVSELKAAGMIGDTVVIQTGTNGQVTSDQFAQLMTLLPAAEVPQVVFLTVRAPKKAWIDGNNERIWALPGQYSNVSILDWKGLVDNGAIPGLAGDGIHLGTTAAKQTYANYIFGQIGHNELIVPVEAEG